MENTNLSAREIAVKSLKIAGQICIYTNDQMTIEELKSETRSEPIASILRRTLKVSSQPIATRSTAPWQSFYPEPPKIRRSHSMR